MIIEDLIRLGKPLLSGGMSACEILELISDVNDDRVKNFFRHVFVVELPPEGDNTDPIVLPRQVWGQEATVEGKGKKVDFVPDVKRALGAPFVLPAGGNPLHAQGSYGVPVYPCWDRHLQDFYESSESVRRFLDGRLARTPGVALNESVREKLATVIHKQVAQLNMNSRDKALGVLVLAECVGEKAPYFYKAQPSTFDLGQSKLQPGKFITPRFERILDAVWAAKLQEGADMGDREGACSICGRGERVVSSYCKAWPWALPEWNCPLPQGGNEKLMVEGVALDEPCYRALTLGANIFGKLTRSVHHEVTRELFSPVADREGRNASSRRKLSDLPTIRGAVYLLPLHDEALDDPDIREDFISIVQAMLRPSGKKGPYLERYLDSVTGFELFLPEEAEKADYRLNLLYFHGDTTRGDVHLRAFIQDVIPSTLRQLREIAQASAETAVELLKALSPGVSEKQIAYHHTLYGSVPYVLARAYGGSYLWDQLETAVRRRPLDAFRPMINTARRMNSLAARYPDTRFDLNDEVIFYLTFLDFLIGYNERFSSNPDHQEETASSYGGRSAMAMRPWKELLKVVSEEPVDELRYDSPAELGFGCGVLTRQFGRLYWNVTKIGKEGKDFLKHRVLTFGSDLSPDAVWKRGLAKMFDVAARYEKLRLSDDFRKRVGITLAEFDRLQEEIRANRDAFMSAFWSGHALQGYGKTTADNDLANEAANSSEYPGELGKSERGDQ